MSYLFEITAGWTGELGPFTLKRTVDGVTTAMDLTGFAGSDIVLKLALETDPETFVDTDGDVRIDSTPTSGKVYYTPDEDDFVSPAFPATVYRMRWELTDGSGHVVFFPSAEGSRIKVWKV